MTEVRYSLFLARKLTPHANILLLAPTTAVRRVALVKFSRAPCSTLWPACFETPNREPLEH